MKIFNVVLLCGIVGCSFLPRAKQAVEPSVSGRIIQQQKLADGGNLVVVPFTAGVHVSASEDLDKAALMLIRGIKEQLQDARQFTMILDRERYEDYDLMVTGRVERFETRSGWKRYIGGKRTRYIELSGKVVDKQGDLVATFQYGDERPYLNMSEIDFLLMVGKDIGLFLSEQ